MTIETICLEVSEQQREARFFDPPLWMQRRSLASQILHDFNVQSVVDIGCGEGALVELLKNSLQFTEIIGVEIDAEAIELAKQAAQPTQYQLMYPRERSLRVELFLANVLSFPWQRLVGADCIVSLEVIEHLTQPVLSAFASTVFGIYKPQLVIVSTPNAEFNIHFPNLNYGTPMATFRHEDHKFEWTRLEFESWARDICIKYGYKFVVTGVGRHQTDESCGFCSQFAIFTRDTDIHRSPSSSSALSDGAVEPVFAIDHPHLAPRECTTSEIVEMVKTKFLLKDSLNVEGLKEEEKYSYDYYSYDDDYKNYYDNDIDKDSFQNDKEKDNGTAFEESDGEQGLTLKRIWSDFEIREACSGCIDILRDHLIKGGALLSPIKTNSPWAPLLEDFGLIPDYMVSELTSN